MTFVQAPNMYPPEIYQRLFWLRQPSPSSRSNTGTIRSSRNEALTMSPTKLSRCVNELSNLPAKKLA